MRCPMCENETLTPVVRHGVELDFCPRCKGVWLDRGELETLLDVADGIGSTYTPAGPAPAASAPPPPQPQRSDRDRDRDDDDRERDRTKDRDRDRDRDRGHDRDRDRDRDRSRRRKKRKNKFSDLLDDVFDFD